MATLATCARRLAEHHTASNVLVHDTPPIDRHMKRMFVLYGEVVPYVYHQCDWLEVGLRDSLSVLPENGLTSLIDFPL